MKSKVFSIGLSLAVGCVFSITAHANEPAPTRGEVVEPERIGGLDGRSCEGPCDCDSGTGQKEWLGDDCYCVCPSEAAHEEQMVE